MDYRFHFASVLVECSYVVYVERDRKRLETLVDAYINGAGIGSSLHGHAGNMLGSARILAIHFDVFEMAVPRRRHMIKQALEQGLVEKLELCEAWFRLERKREAGR